MEAYLFLCNTVAGISGGVQATCKRETKYFRPGHFPVARTPQVRTGILAALDKKNRRDCMGI